MAFSLPLPPISSKEFGLEIRRPIDALYQKLGSIRQNTVLVASRNVTSAVVKLELNAETRQLMMNQKAIDRAAAKMAVAEATAVTQTFSQNVVSVSPAPAEYDDPIAAARALVAAAHPDTSEAAQYKLEA